MGAILKGISAVGGLSKALPATTDTLQTVGTSAFRAVEATFPAVGKYAPSLIKAGGLAGKVMLPANILYTCALSAQDWRRNNSEGVAGHIGSFLGGLGGGACVGFAASVLLGCTGPTALIIGAIGSFACGVVGGRAAEAFLAAPVGNVMNSVNSLELPDFISSGDEASQTVSATEPAAAASQGMKTPNNIPQNTPNFFLHAHVYAKNDCSGLKENAVPQDEEGTDIVPLMTSANRYYPVP